MAVSADGNTLWVVNSNFDQRFNAGWITQIDVVGLAGAILAADAQDPNTLNLAAFATQSVAVPSLGGDLVVDGAHQRAYLAHRGLSLVTILDIQTSQDGTPTLTCGNVADKAGLSNVEKQTDCDRAHLRVLMRDWGTGGPPSAAAAIQALADPAALALVNRNPNQTEAYPVLAVGYLGAPYLTFLQTDEQAANIRSIQTMSTQTGTLGRLLAVPDAVASSITGRLLGATHFLSGQFDRSALYALDLLQDANQVQNIAPSVVQRFDFGEQIGVLSGAADLTAAIFSQRDPSRLFVAHHNPDAISMLRRDIVPTSFLDANGIIQYQQTLSTKIVDTKVLDRARVHQLAYVQRDVGDLLVASSLAHDMLYFFDPTHDAIQEISRLPLKTGQGPYDLMHLRVHERDLLFVTTFFDHGLTIVDLSASNPADFKIVVSLRDAEFSPTTL